jgi:hypothetical protein
MRMSDLCNLVMQVMLALRAAPRLEQIGHWLPTLVLCRLVMIRESAKGIRQRARGCDRTTYRTKSVNIHSKHPPNQKKADKCHQNVAGPLAWRLRIAKVKHAAIVASSVAKEDTAIPSFRDEDDSSGS